MKHSPSVPCRSPPPKRRAITINSGGRGNTRFAVNQISTGGDNYDATISVRSTIGKRSAVVNTNKLDDASLKSAVELSERLAKLSPEDPEAMPELGPQTYSTSQGWSEATASLDPSARANAARAITEPSRAAGLVSTGYLETQAGAIAIANSKGLFAYNKQTALSLTTTVRTEDGTGSGWAGATSHDFSTLDPRDLGARAIDKAKRSVNPVAIEPGRYTTILEPTAVGNLIQFITFAMNARNADEGRSFFSKAGGGNKIGMKVVDERITISSDPLDPEAYANTFSFDGQPIPEDDVDRERRREEPLVRSLLGREAGEDARAHEWNRAHVGRSDDDGSNDRIDGTRCARHALLVSPPRRPANDPLYGPDARRDVSHRARKDHARHQELPFQ